MPGKLANYKAIWAARPPGAQAEEYQREVAVGRVEQQLQTQGLRMVEGERERLAGAAETVSRSAADIQAAARAITKACQSRIVNVEEVADQLDELEKQARKNRAAIARIEEMQDANESRAQDPVELMERMYNKYPQLPHPADDLPAFRTDSEQSSPAVRR